MKVLSKSGYSLLTVPVRGRERSLEGRIAWR
jgi:hypothetical protein